MTDESKTKTRVPEPTSQLLPNWEETNANGWTKWRQIWKVFKTSWKIRVLFKSKIFFADVHWVMLRIVWEIKIFFVMGTLSFSNVAYGLKCDLTMYQRYCLESTHFFTNMKHGRSRGVRLYHLTMPSSAPSQISCSTFTMKFWWKYCRIFPAFLVHLILVALKMGWVWVHTNKKIVRNVRNTMPNLRRSNETICNVARPVYRLTLRPVATSFPGSLPVPFSHIILVALKMGWVWVHTNKKIVRNVRNTMPNLRRSNETICNVARPVYRLTLRPVATSFPGSLPVPFSHIILVALKMGWVWVHTNKKIVRNVRNTMPNLRRSNETICNVARPVYRLTLRPVATSFPGSLPVPFSHIILVALKMGWVWVHTNKKIVRNVRNTMPNLRRSNETICNVARPVYRLTLRPVATSFPGSLPVPFSLAPVDGKRRDPGNEVVTPLSLQGTRRGETPRTRLRPVVDIR